MRELVRTVAETLPTSGPVYEFGAFQVPGQEDIADMRGFFPDVEYIGTDMREGRGVDQIVDVQKTGLPDGVAGVVLCLDTLEHVQNPIAACREMARLTRPGGWALMTTVFAFQIHDYPADYWRFTPECMAMLMGWFGTSAIGQRGPQLAPHTVFGVGIQVPDYNLTALQWRVGEMVRAWQD